MQEVAGGIDMTPWKWAWEVSALAVIAMVAVYALFSPWGLIAPVEERAGNVWTIAIVSVIATAAALFACAKKRATKGSAHSDVF